MQSFATAVELLQAFLSFYSCRRFSPSLLQLTSTQSFTLFINLVLNLPVLCSLFSLHVTSLSFNLFFIIQVICPSFFAYYYYYYFHFTHIFFSFPLSGGFDWQIVVVVLVIVDTVVVVAELILDLGHHHNENSLAPLVLHALSLVLLSLFFIEVLLKIYTFRREFLTQKAEVLDAVVVTVALCLDIVFVHHQAGYGLIIILRLWRVVRIQNAVIMQVRLMREERRHRALGNQRGTTPIS
ncbi:voltage-gated hydrogen channel 1-like [Homarus americanus]|uniref:voltage-gated hydrogen channel 1-like n=1 Tax=Homarus americanus TaxID=6706 RepID=UPI001C46501D|nr:voltage-gated hydrogen channel 1-like [Homarus americanus]